MARQLTGRRVALVICGGFAIVIAVNITLATMAGKSHPGLVVDNSYIASQNFNGWLAAGRKQRAMGWTVHASTADGMMVIEATDRNGEPLTGLVGHATITHPLGAEPARTLTLAETGDGLYTAGPISRGQWIAEIRLPRGEESFYLKKRMTGG